MRILKRINRYIGEGLAKAHQKAKEFTGRAKDMIKKTRHLGNSFAHELGNVPIIGAGLRRGAEAIFESEQDALGGRSMKDVFHQTRRNVDQADRLANNPSVGELRNTIRQAEEQGLVQAGGLNRRLDQLERLRV